MRDWFLRNVDDFLANKTQPQLDLLIGLAQKTIMHFDSSKGSFGDHETFAFR